MQTVEDYLAEARADMTAADVLEMIGMLAQARFNFHVDGGWGVDALLGYQTRRHEDLDIAVRHQDVVKLRDLFGARSYREVLRDDTWECNFVLADDAGHMIDIHSYEFDAAGKNIFGVPYPAEALTGNGVIDGVRVPCISPKWQVEFHTGYKVDAQDFHDVTLLCEAFGLDLPPDYDKFL